MQIKLIGLCWYQCAFQQNIQQWQICHMVVAVRMLLAPWTAAQLRIIVTLQVGSEQAGFGLQLFRYNNYWSGILVSVTAQWAPVSHWAGQCHSSAGLQPSPGRCSSSVARDELWMTQLPAVASLRHCLSTATTAALVMFRVTTASTVAAASIPIPGFPKRITRCQTLTWTFIRACMCLWEDEDPELPYYRVLYKKQSDGEYLVSSIYRKFHFKKSQSFALPFLWL